MENRLPINAISRFFLRARHWQIFLLLLALGIVGNVIIVTFMLRPQASLQFQQLEIINGIVTIPFLLCFLWWFWSMGSFLNSVVQPRLRLNGRFFAFALLYPSIYVFAFFVLINNAKPSLLFALILPFHLLAMVCILYPLYFTSKSLVLAETNSSASFRDYAGAFFLLWFFPIGVWFTQPRINRLYARATGIGEAASDQGVA